ncbi:MAG: CPBP family intramembrane metalloprotease [PVC group bacterium]|nr:CPBP family intramembrane metalloprotease [PVC group bacterium]
MRIGKPKTKIERNRSTHTKIGFFLGLIAVLVEMYLGIMYLFSTDASDQQFGQLTLMEGFFALIGLYAIDVVSGRKVGIKPDDYEPLHKYTFMRMLVILLTIIVIQVIFQMAPLTVRDVDRAMAIMFAGPAEELFFRGLMISLFVAIGASFPGYVIRRKSSGKEEKTISPMEIMGIFLSSILFAFMHTNYYADIGVILSVFVSGIALGFFYWWWRDLTANILAHFLLNIITVAQVFWLVSF